MSCSVRLVLMPLTTSHALSIDQTFTLQSDLLWCNELISLLWSKNKQTNYHIDSDCLASHALLITASQSCNEKSLNNQLSQESFVIYTTFENHCTVANKYRCLSINYLCWCLIKLFLNLCLCSFFDGSPLGCALKIMLITD